LDRPSTLPDLITALADLDGLPPIERARRCPDLIEAAKGVLARTRAAAIAEAVARGTSQAAAGRELGMSRQKIHDIITAHNATQETTMTFTSHDLRDQVVTATDASDGTYDVDAIVAEIVDRHGAVPVASLEHDEFWAIVAKHAVDPEAVMITLYETNSDLLILARNAVAWDMGAPGASPGYLEGTFAEDAEAWATDVWDPNTGDGQMPTEIGDDLTAVATWDKDQGVRLLVDRENLGGAAEIYLYGR
jgi:hypothetical protein